MKKAKIIEVENPIFLVIAIFTLVILVFVVGKVGFAADKNSEVAYCAAQAKTTSLMHLGLSDLSQKIICPTKYIQIDKKKDNEIMQETAQEMKNCWDKWVRGTAQLFEGDKGLFCAVCSSITYSEKNKNLDFGKFLVTKTYNNKNTWYQYLTNSESETANEEVNDIQKIREFNDYMAGHVIDTSEDQVVIFVYAKGVDYINKVIEYVTLQSTASQVNAGFGVVAGVGAGALAIGIIKGVSIVGISIATAPAAAIVAGVTIIVGGIVWALTGYFSPHFAPEYAATLIIEPYNSDRLKTLGCEYYPVSQGIR